MAPSGVNSVQGSASAAAGPTPVTSLKSGLLPSGPRVPATRTHSPLPTSVLLLDAQRTAHDGLNVLTAEGTRVCAKAEGTFASTWKKRNRRRYVTEIGRKNRPAWLNPKAGPLVSANQHALQCACAGAAPTSVLTAVGAVWGPFPHCGRHLCVTEGPPHPACHRLHISAPTAKIPPRRSAGGATPRGPRPCARCFRGLPDPSDQEARRARPSLSHPRPRTALRRPNTNSVNIMGLVFVCDLFLAHQCRVSAVSRVAQDNSSSRVAPGSHRLDSPGFYCGNSKGQRKVSTRRHGFGATSLRGNRAGDHGTPAK